MKNESCVHQFVNWYGRVVCLWTGRNVSTLKSSASLFQVLQIWKKVCNGDSYVPSNVYMIWCSGRLVSDLLGVSVHSRWTNGNFFMYEAQ